MHVNLSWLKVEERLTSSLLFMRVIEKFNAPSCLSKLLAHSSDTHANPTKHATRGLFTVPKSRTYDGRHTVLHRVMTTYNSIPHQVTYASSKITPHFVNKLFTITGILTGQDTVYCECVCVSVCVCVCVCVLCVCVWITGNWRKWRRKKWQQFYGRPTN
jgi:hypothetical protein